MHKLTTIMALFKMACKLPRAEKDFGISAASGIVFVLLPSSEMKVEKKKNFMDSSQIMRTFS